MLFYVVKKKESSFFTIFFPSMLWTISASPVCSPLSVSLENWLLSEELLRWLMEYGFIVFKTRPITAQWVTHCDIHHHPRPTPSPFMNEGCAPAAGDAAGRPPSAVSSCGECLTKENYLTWSYPSYQSWPASLPDPWAVPELTVGPAEHSQHQSSVSASAHPAFFLTFCMLISDSESASQETQSAVGIGMDVKKNVLLNKYSNILPETHKFKESVYDNKLI